MRPTPCALLTAVAAATVGLTGATIASADATIGWVELDGPLLDKPDPFAWLAGPGAAPTLLDVIDTFDEAAHRDDIDALVVRLREPALTLSQIEEIGVAMGRVRQAGKQIHVFADIYGPGGLMLGAFADDVLLQSGGAVTFPGVYMEEMFLADTLAMAGLKADYVQIGAYKGAQEQMVNSAPSKEWDENISQLLDSLYANQRAIVKNGRSMNDTKLDRAMDEAWLADGVIARRIGLIDGELDRLDLDAWLEKKHGGFDYDTDLGPAGGAGAIDLANPFAMLSILSKNPANHPTRDTIAVVHIDGPIMDGESSPASLFGGSSVGSVTIRQALAEIENDGLIKGLIVRIDSPGGSAIASESIWLGVRRVAAKKPVWVSVGSMAASGGYYIAVSGDKIYANPSSIVGSIGVVGGKIARAGLYDKLSIGITPRARGPHAAMFGSLNTWTESDRALVTDRMTDVYDLFVRRVRAGRQGIDIAKTAEGRLFTGEKALGLDMVDRIGGFEVAITDMAKELGLRDGRYDLMSYPGPKSITEMLEDMFSGFGVSAPGTGRAAASNAFAGFTAAAEELLGPTSWATLRDAMNAMRQLDKENVLLVSPRVLLFR
jgi:protease-4